jgi:hypothetical protein
MGECIDISTGSELLQFATLIGPRLRMRWPTPGLDFESFVILPAPARVGACCCCRQSSQVTVTSRTSTSRRDDKSKAGTQRQRGKTMAQQTKTVHLNEPRSNPHRYHLVHHFLSCDERGDNRLSLSWQLDATICLTPLSRPPTKDRRALLRAKDHVVLRRTALPF